MKKELKASLLLETGALLFYLRQLETIPVFKLPPVGTALKVIMKSIQKIERKVEYGDE
jgi:hypothetical protein